MPAAEIATTRRADHSTVRVALSAAAALALVMGLGRFAFTPMVPYMRDSAGLATYAAGLVAAANHLGYMVGAVCYRFMVVAGTRRVRWVTVTITAAATTALMGVTASTSWWMVIRFANGLAAAVVFLEVASVLFTTTRRARTRVLVAFVYGGIGFGVVASSIVLSFATATTDDADRLWFVLAIPAAILTAIAFCMPMAPVGVVPGRPRFGDLGAQVRWLAAAYGCAGFGYIVVATFLVTLIRDVGMERWYETLAWTVFGLAAIPSTLIWGRVAQKLSPHAALLSAYLVQASGATAVALWPQPFTVVLAAVLLGGTFVGITTLGLAMAAALEPRAADHAVAAITMMFATGQVLGPGTVAAVLALGGTLPLVTGGAAIVLCSGAAIVATRVR